MEYNKTALSIDLAEERGFIHRDYIAHCLRWTHIIKLIGNKYKYIKILDIGCGKEIPLAKTMYTARMSPQKEFGGLYHALDLNNLEIPKILKMAVETGKFPLTLYTNTNIINFNPEIKYNLIVCLEVLEHMPPKIVIETLKQFKKLLAIDGKIIISTPNYNGNAAANHPNEMTTKLLLSIFHQLDLKVERLYGTFASQKDYRDCLKTKNFEVVFNELSEYYDTNYLATIFAPLFPEHSRNILYELTYSQYLFLDTDDYIIKYDETVSNNPEWREILKNRL